MNQSSVNNIGFHTNERKGAMMLHVVDTTSVTSHTRTADAAGSEEVLDYDGDSELPNQTGRIAKKKFNETTTRKSSDVEDTAKADKESVTSTSLSPSSDRCVSTSSSSSSSSSRANCSAVIKVSSLQASFAEKTASEMQEIIGWYNQYNESDRFTKILQSKTLPDNAMVCDDDDDDDDDDQSSDLLQQGDSAEALEPSTPKSARKGSSSQTMQVLEQSEAVKSILMNTQYMADIILELEQSSSSSDADNVSSDSTLTTASSSCTKAVRFDDDKDKKGQGIKTTIRKEDSHRTTIKSRRLQQTAPQTKIPFPWLVIISFTFLLFSFYIAWISKQKGATITSAHSSIDISPETFCEVETLHSSWR